MDHSNNNHELPPSSSVSSMADNDDMPALEPISTDVQMAEPSEARPNRRARVEDDDDEDRDRRHPSQRINTPLPSQPALSALLDTLGAPPPEFPAQPTANAAPSTAPSQPTITTEIISFSVDIGPLFNGAPTAEGAPGPQIPGGFPAFSADALREMLGIEPEVDDPERADRLIAGLEEVPVGLVKRLERVGGMTGANGEDLSGGDSGCAVCWEKLLDSDSEDKEGSKIVSLPCAHVFHADCLKPWFSRAKHTTCPTCRFNIDPEDLTYVPYRQRQSTRQQQQQAAEPTTESDAPRGRSDTQEPARRTTSEPPTNRPRPQQDRPQSPPSFQSFSVPGGHIIVVNQPLDIGGGGGESRYYLQTQHLVVRAPVVGADLYPRLATGNQPQQAPPPTPARTADAPNATGATPTPAAAAANPGPQPTPPAPGPGANPTPRTTMPGGGQLPAGMVAFDIHLPFPFPIPFGPPPHRAATPVVSPAPTQPTPPGQGGQPLRLPTAGFAGINFGQQAGPPPDVATVMRRLFGGMPMLVPGATPAVPGSPLPAAANAVRTTTPPAVATPPPATPPPAAPTPAANITTPPSTGPMPAPPNMEGLPPVPPEFENIMRNYLNNPAVLLRLIMSAAMAGNIPPGAMATPPGAAGTPPGAGTTGAPTAATASGAPPTIPLPPAGGVPFTAGGFPFPGGFPLFSGASTATPPPTREKKQWTPPAAPGPTLRQRVERREREAGLRCCDVSCGIGPSDEDPVVVLSEELARMCSIQPSKGDEKKVCGHTFHASCLVSAERVALRGAREVEVDGCVEVSCPVCRAAGVISKGEWDEGVGQLA